MRALRSFTVRPRLPGGLEPLDRLAGNLRWSWDRPTRELFAGIDPRVWDEGGHDPRRVLAETPTARLEELALAHEVMGLAAPHAAQLPSMGQALRALSWPSDVPGQLELEAAETSLLVAQPDILAQAADHHLDGFEVAVGGGVVEVVREFAAGDDAVLVMSGGKPLGIGTIVQGSLKPKRLFNL